MTDDNTDNSGEALTVAEMMDFASTRVEQEMEDFPGDVPKHAASLLVSDIGALHGTLMNVQMAESNDEMDTPDDEAIASALESDVVDIILAIGALAHEYGLDIEDAFEERMDLMQAHDVLEDAIENADTQEEMMEAVEEHLGDGAMEQMMGGMMGGGGAMAPPPEPGDDVSSDDYDPEDPERHIQ